MYSDNSDNNILINCDTEILSTDSPAPIMEISHDEINLSIEKAKLSYNSGTDSIPITFIKNISNSIILPFAYFIQ